MIGNRKIFFKDESIEPYRYGFNGKEKDDEGMGGGGQTYDYGFRIYNPALAKFLSVDPLCHDYPWYTPYQFAGNMPIYAIDLDGLEPSPGTFFQDSKAKISEVYTFIKENLGISNVTATEMMVVIMKESSFNLKAHAGDDFGLAQINSSWFDDGTISSKFRTVEVSESLAKGNWYANVFMGVTILEYGRQMENKYKITGLNTAMDKLKFAYGCYNSSKGHTEWNDLSTTCGKNVSGIPQAIDNLISVVDQEISYQTNQLKTLEAEKETLLKEWDSGDFEYSNDADALEQRIVGTYKEIAKHTEALDNLNELKTNLNSIKSSEKQE